MVICLLLVLAVGVVHAQDSGGITFVFWNSGPEAQPGWEKIIAEFNKKFPDIKVKLLPVEGTNWGSIYHLYDILYQLQTHMHLRLLR